jgi:L-alanine-DL-glutamate epimerase-like enolase superfamily enzyme
VKILDFGLAKLSPAVDPGCRAHVHSTTAKSDRSEPAARSRTDHRPRSPVPIAGGEVLTRRQSFQPWLEGGAFDIVQPDVTKVGGISEERRIAWMAQEHSIRFIPHGWNTAIGLAADLQLASAFSNTDLVEYLAPRSGRHVVDSRLARARLAARSPRGGEVHRRSEALLIQLSRSLTPAGWN